MRVRFRYRFAAGAQRTVCRVVMFFLFRALNALSVRDSRVAAEIAPWPEARVLGLEVPGGPSLYIARRAERLARLKTCAAPDILIRFKSVRDAFYVFTGQMGVEMCIRDSPHPVRKPHRREIGFHPFNGHCRSPLFYTSRQALAMPAASSPNWASSSLAGPE